MVTVQKPAFFGMPGTNSNLNYLWLENSLSVQILRSFFYGGYYKITEGKMELVHNLAGKQDGVRRFFE